MISIPPGGRNRNKGGLCFSSRDIDDWQFFAKVIVPENSDQLEYKCVVERRFHGSYEVGTMEIQVDYSFSVAPAVAGCSSSTATAKRSKRSIETEVSITVSGETLREVGDMLLKVDQVTVRFRLIDWVHYYRVSRKMDEDKAVRVQPLRTLLLDDGYLE
uniref:Uncharacterized protein n=1 Tax=Tanacetum cinerariifolium TaxID=118510 RepID=A0A699L5L2_TANCI|nr:hypothetical protein [Tanacetum cinerariifolium]